MSLRETIKVPEKCQQYYLNAAKSDSENCENYVKSQSWPKWEDAKNLNNNAPKRNPGQKFSPEQSKMLLDIFSKTKKPDLEQRIDCAEKLGLKMKAVNSWFERHSVEIFVFFWKCDKRDIYSQFFQEDLVKTAHLA